jgi:hypothetical protein
MKALRRPLDPAVEDKEPASLIPSHQLKNRYSERIAGGERRRAELARAFRANALKRSETAASVLLNRPGVSSSTTIRYAKTSDPQRWYEPEAGAAILDAIIGAALDGADRLVFVWPNRLGGALVSTSLAMQRARASGTLGYATFGYWPWRSGATFAARSILVNPADLLAVARKVCTEIERGAPWANGGLAHEDLSLLELRLAELLKPGHGQRPGKEGGEPVVVRSPTVLETTVVFPPESSGAPPYTADPDQVLRRVRQYTCIGELRLDDRVGAAGDPLRAPFAVLGLPAATTPEKLLPYLRCARVAACGMDVLIADLTATSRHSLTDWEKPFAALLAGLDAVQGRRPPVVAVAEDGHAFTAARRALRVHASAMSPRRAVPLETGGYLPGAGVIGSREDLPPVVFEPDIKDASLAPIRNRLLAMGAKLRERGEIQGIAAVSRALRFLRRVASLPIGVEEARRAADILYAEDDFAARAAFRPKMELAPLGAVANNAPDLGREAERLAREIEEKVESWADETPVSAKLAALLDSAGGRAASVTVAMPSERIGDVFLSSERALRWDCDVVAAGALAGRLAARQPKQIVVVGPTPELVRVLLTSIHVPHRVVLIGDTAGVGLIRSEIWPITRVDAFRPLASRAGALYAALARSGADEKLDLGEFEFRVRATAPEGEVDFTRAGDDYKGDIVRIGTAGGGRFAYRAGGDVLVYSPGELRPFVRSEARHVVPGASILAMRDDVRETLRRALSGSRRIQQELATYHEQIAKIRARLPGATHTDQARRVVADMKRLDPSISDDEVSNVRRWLTADLADRDAEGYRIPGAARDWRRFSLFARAIGMPEVVARAYWEGAIRPTRSYRVHEGYAFNQRLVQFVLDPEGVAIGAGLFARLPDLWQLVLAAVDEVASVKVERYDGSGGHAGDLARDARRQKAHAIDIEL